MTALRTPFTAAGRPRSRRVLPRAEATLLRSKLARPRLVDAVLERPRLLGALASHAERPVSLVVSDAGYGKTTLLTGFVRTLRRPVVWYSLMPSDADLVVFGTHLVAGFREQAPRFGRAFQRALAEGTAGATPEWLAGLLLADLERLTGPPALLVLDDFHELHAAAPVLRLLDALVRGLPPQVRLLIGSREPPRLGLERLRVRGDLFELDSTHLRFTRDELERLFADVYRRPLDEAELGSVEAATGGWPTAVHLVHQSLTRAPDLTLGSVLDDFRGSNLDLRDFLSSEILARLAADERRVLERTAVLQRFDAGLAAALTGVRDTIAVLHRLGRRGLVRPYGSGASSSWELHELVRQFLRGHVERTHGAGAWTALEGETGALLASRGEPERALPHLLHGGRTAEARAVLSGLAPRLVREGRADTLLQFVSDAPAGMVGDDLDLRLAVADACQAAGRWDEAACGYDDVLRESEEHGHRLHACRALLGQTRLLNLRGRHEQVLGMAQRGLAMLGGADRDLRLRLLQRVAGAHFYLGQHHEAVRILSEIRAQLPSPDHDLALPVTHNLAMAWAAMGRLREASHEFEAALAAVRGAPSPKTPLYLSNRAFLLAALGELADARAAAEEGLAAARRFGNRAQEITCRQALAQVLAETGDLDGALAALREAEALNQELRMELVAGDLLALRGRIFCARGQFRRAIEFLQQALARLGDTADRPRHLEYRVLTAWCELRAGRHQVARDLLESLTGRADAAENDLERMRVHYWLAEARLALGDRTGAKRSLGLALGLVADRGYGHFVAGQAREEAAPLVFALEHGIGTDVAAAALVAAGPAVEGALLDRLDGVRAGRHEAIAAVLAEIGGQRALERLPRVAARHPGSRAAVRTAVRRIEARLRPASGPAADGTPAPRVRLALHGSPRLEVDGRPVPASAWRAQRAFQILIWLALHPRGGSRDRLLETFWPGRQLAAGRRNFHPTLSYIRSVLPRAAVAPLLREGEHYRLDPAYPLTCDVWELERGLAAAREAREAAARRAAYEQALAPAALPLLDGVDAGWAGEAQARSRDQLEQACIACGEACLQAGDPAAALPWLRRAVELDAFRETTRVTLIACLVRTGQRRAAVVEEERMTALLRSELGVDPLPETRARVRALLGGPAAGSPPEPEVRGRQMLAAPGQVAGKPDPGD